MDDDCRDLSRRAAPITAPGPGPVGAAAPEPESGPKGDFGFPTGAWGVRHRKLKRRLAGETDRREFDGTCRAWTVLDGAASVDDNLLDDPTAAYGAATFRRLDQNAREWSIWWFDGRRGSVDPPVRGGFRVGTGTFFAEDELDGRPITVRFIGSEITQRSARWEQTFSPDRGAAWEVNWIMRFERAA